MSKKWLFLLLVVQARQISPCVFDRVEMVRGKYYQKVKSENECFAQCYEDNNCIAFAHRKVEKSCYLFKAGDTPYDCIPGNICYAIQRDEVDSMCERYVDV
ncbi:unnamed protein product [Cylicocyclus nassatus]|uniref:Apple domain-containing protein n=1 Tax=Cylicocyclus nassatus TaxID=53992 RepID=A0AA36H8R4_CYLNA|nr:unnamed protein product [Cylicocyclus nassatus]